VRRRLEAGCSSFPRVILPAIDEEGREVRAGVYAVDHRSDRIQDRPMEVRDYNGTGRGSRDAIIERYKAYCRALGVREGEDLHPREHTERGTTWVYPVMDRLIPLIEAGDPAAIAIGVEFIEDDTFMPFGRILKANTARALRRAKLTREQIERLRRHVVGLLLAGTVRREFREYAKLLRKIGVGHWWPEIERGVDRNNRYVMRYVKYLQQQSCARWGSHRLDWRG